MNNIDLSFYRGKRVLVTGHTGFKGAWLCKILVGAGAEVLGYSRCSVKDPSLFELSGLERELVHIKGDVRNFDGLLEAFSEFSPEIVFHLAAQPIVREGYADPLYTYGTNFMGTVNVLECIRRTPSVKSAVIVTTDKVYRNNEWAWGYRENEPLDGFDPYSNSKSCAELAAASYRRSFFGGQSAEGDSKEAAGGVPVSTARAGNVLGGGDFARDRIIPDCVRAMQRGETIVVRNPRSTRPFQHVLEPLFAYLMIAKEQWGRPELSGAYNIGPEDAGCVSASELAELFCRLWGEGARWESRREADAPHEANFLKLDCSLIRSAFGWRPKWDIEECMRQTVEFYKIWLAGGDVVPEMQREIRLYLGM